ncbi:WRKY transcription factor [Quillaja saponaria]|uniref:WRKY transcription factor n=1 Tax=Quillaja saponaria TaxID=32244 RepID=A0AAD7L926_QUISA|nr:WRKY transcription factor [Quillaja saponaria]
MDHEGQERASSSNSSAPPSRPTITLPPRTSMESLFNGGVPGGGFGFSPGPMTLVSSFFSDNDDSKSFSQLLAGAMSSPAAVPSKLDGFPPLEERDSYVGTGFKQNRLAGLAISQSPNFTIPPGLSPAGLLDSSGLFSPAQGPLGMTHQQALAQVTAQATQAHSHMHIQTDYSSSVSAEPATSLAQRLQSSSLTVDKPADDGYNWRKYGQKQMKGSEFPRSYYKCTHRGCPVKKKVERSLDGQVTAIIYRGQHNHQPPEPTTRRPKDTGNPNENSNNKGNSDSASQPPARNLKRSKEGIASYSMSKKDQEYSQTTAEHLSGTSDSEEVGDAETGEDRKDEDEPHPKRRNPEVRVPEPASSHRTVTESRIIVQTTSKVDLLDDGYRWRKYGQKVVKGNPYPRSYYKCTAQGCNVRKHVERASTDPKDVITTYEGKHNHDVPAAKTSSHNIASNSASQLKSNTTVTEKHTFNNRDLAGNDQRPVASLRLKEEQIT